MPYSILYKVNPLRVWAGCFLGIVAFLFPMRAAQADNSEIKIGALLILSGEGASWGTASKNGIELAIDRINSDGGVLGRKVSVVYQDSGSEPKSAIAAFRQLVDVQGIQIIIGPSWSRLGLPLIDLANKRKILMISPSIGLSKFNESSPYLFTTWPHDYIASEKLADYVYEKGRRRVALVGAEEPWVEEQTQAFKKRFEAIGGEVIFMTSPSPGSVDLKTVALKISKLKDLDAVVSTTDGVLIGSLVAKALKEIKFSVPLYSITLDQGAIDVAQGGFEGLEFLTFLTPTEEFQANYESRFKVPIELGSDSAYDAVMMLFEALKASGSGSIDSQRISTELAQIKEFNGVSGTLVSDGKRGFIKDFVVMKIRNGKPELLERQENLYKK